MNSTLKFFLLKPWAKAINCLSAPPGLKDGIKKDIFINLERIKLIYAFI